MLIFWLFRESKVTMLLKDALGGNCKTKALVTLHPSDSSSLSTVLRTAGQLAQVQNYPVINDFMAKVCVFMWKFKFLIWSGEKWSWDVQVNRCKVKWDCSKQSQWVDHPSGVHHFTKMLTSAELVENVCDHHQEHSFSTFLVPSHDHQTTQFSETFSRIFYV